MSYNSLRENEKRWQRKRLFRKRQPISRLTSALLFLVLIIVLAGWWLELLPFFSITGPSLS